MTLKGKRFPADVIPEDIWKQKVQNLITLIFEESTLRIILDIDAYLTFEILKLLFEPKLASEIE